MKSYSRGKLLLLLSLWCLCLGSLAGCGTTATNPAPPLDDTTGFDGAGLGGGGKPAAPVASVYPKFVESDFKDAAELAKRLKEHTGPVAAHLYGKFKDRPLAPALEKYDPNQPPGPDLKQTLVTEFNQLLTDKELYNARAFQSSSVEFSAATRKLLDRYDKLNAPEMEFLNRRLLEDAYPNAIARGPATAVPTVATGEDTQLLKGELNKLKGDNDAQEIRLTGLEKKNAAQAKQLAEAEGGWAQYLVWPLLLLGVVSLALSLINFRTVSALGKELGKNNLAHNARFEFLENQVRQPKDASTKPPPVVMPLSPLPDEPPTAAPRYGVPASDMSGVPDTTNAVTDAMASRIQYLQQDLKDLQSKLDYNRTDLRDAVGAIIALTEWLMQTQTVGQANRAAQPDTTALRALVNNYDGDLQQYEEAVKPLLQQLNDTLNRWHNAPALTPAVRETLGQMSNRLSLYSVWRNRLAQAQHIAPASPATDWQGEAQRLDAERQSGRLTTAQWIEQKRQLLQRQALMLATTNANAPTLPDETELRRVLAGASADMMACYDQLAQLQAQAGASSGWGDELRRLQSTAREVLLKFDLQPEEITVGRDRYDPRLHDLALVRTQPGMAANTILEVLQSGFCQRSTGKTVRRPKVVAAGTSV